MGGLEGGGWRRQRSPQSHLLPPRPLPQFCSQLLNTNPRRSNTPTAPRALQPALSPCRTTVVAAPAGSLDPPPSLCTRRSDGARTAQHLLTQSEPLATWSYLLVSGGRGCKRALSLSSGRASTCAHEDGTKPLPWGGPACDKTPGPSAP